MEWVWFLNDKQICPRLVFIKEGEMLWTPNLVHQICSPNSINSIKGEGEMKNGKYTNKIKGSGPVESNIVCHRITICLS